MTSTPTDKLPIASWALMYEEEIASLFQRTLRKIKSHLYAYNYSHHDELALNEEAFYEAFVEYLYKTSYNTLKSWPH